jgi:hypothetical protein
VFVRPARVVIQPHSQIDRLLRSSLPADRRSHQPPALASEATVIFAATLERGGPWDRSRGLREQDGFPVLLDGLGATRHTRRHG